MTPEDAPTPSETQPEPQAEAQAAAPSQPIDFAALLDPAQLAPHGMEWRDASEIRMRERWQFREEQQRRFDGLELTDYHRNVSNDAFIPIIEPDEGEDENLLRLKGLAAYVTQDIDPDAAALCKQIFGKTRATPNDSYSYMLIGRSLCAGTGYIHNPAGFLQDNGERLGLSIPPNAQDESDLYSAIGQQFSLQTRERIQKIKTERAAAIAARNAEITRLYTEAIEKITNGEFLSPQHFDAMQAAGIDPESVKRAKQAISMYEDAKKAEAKPMYSYKAPQKKASFGSLLYHLISNAPTGQADQAEFYTAPTGGFRDSPLLIDDIADFIGDDQQARALFLNFYRKTIEKRTRELQGDYKGISGAIAGAITKSIQKAEDLGDGIANASARPLYDLFSRENSWDDHLPVLGNVLGKSLAQQRRDAFLSDTSDAYREGVAEAEGPFTWAHLPAKAVSEAANFLPWLTGWGTAAKLVDIYNEESDKTLSRIYTNGGNMYDPLDDRVNRDFESSWWERSAPAALNTASTAVGMRLGGKVMGGVASAFSRALPGLSSKVLSRAGRETANAAWYRVMGSRLGAWGAKSAESAASIGVAIPASEALITTLTDQILPERQVTYGEKWSSIRQNFQDPEWWATQIVAGGIFGAMGVKGARSTALYEGTLSRLNFSKEEINESYRKGEPKQVQEYISEKLYQKTLEDPEGMARRMQEEGLATMKREEAQRLAESGVRDAILKEAGISDMTRDGDGKYTLRLEEKDAEGKPVMREMRWSEAQLESYLITQTESAIIAKMRLTQQLLRGEQGAKAAERLVAEGKSPFAKLAFLSDLPPEILAKTRQKGVIDADVLHDLAEYAGKEIEAKIAAGATRPDAENATIGTTGATLKSFVDAPAQFAARAQIARQTGELSPSEKGESTSFILPGRTPGDSILLLARGEVTASEVAHDWIEGFGRSRYAENPEAFKAMLDHVEATISKSALKTGETLFGGKPQAERTYLDYIEAWTKLAQANFLVNHRNFNLDETSHAAMEHALDDLSSVQSGIALSNLLRSYARDIKEPTDQQRAIKDILEKSGLELRDFYRELEQSDQKQALEYVRGYETRRRQELEQTGEAAIREPATDLEKATAAREADRQPIDAESNITGEELPAETFAPPDPVNKETGELTHPSLFADPPITDINGAGKGLVNGIAAKMPDGSVIGSAAIDGISLHTILKGKGDLEEAALIASQYDSLGEPSLAYRHGNGKLEIISGLSNILRAKETGNPYIQVRVIDKDATFTPQWAANEARAYRIKSHLADPAEIAAHIRENKLTRAEAHEKGLIPRDPDGKETAASRSGWQLAEHASENLLRQLAKGEATLPEALAKSTPKETQAASSNEPTASFSIRPSHRRNYTPLQEMLKERQMEEMIRYAERTAAEISDMFQNHGKPGTIDYQVRTAAAKARAVYNAIHVAFPKEAKPWITLKNAKEQLEIWHDAINKPREDLPANTILDEKERLYFNSQKGIADRLAIARKNLKKLTEKLFNTAAHSLESHLIRKQLETIDKASRILEPKKKPGGKEKIGQTSAQANKQARWYLELMEWTPERVAEESEIRQAKLTDTINTDPAAKDATASELAAITTYGGLRYTRNLADVRRGAESYLNFLHTERNAWDLRQEQEKSIVRRMQNDLARAKPDISQTELKQALQNERDYISNNLKGIGGGFRNFTQSLEAFSTLPGIGTHFKDLETKLAMQLDQNIKYQQQAFHDFNAKLDRILGIENRNSIVRDIKRGRWLVKMNAEHFVTDANGNQVTRKGEIKKTKYDYTKEEWERFLAMTPEQREHEEARIRQEYEKFGGEPKPFPTEQALQMAKERLESEFYRGGRFIIETKGERDKGKEDDLKLSRMQALNLWLMGEQPTYREMFSDLGYTSEVMKGIKEYIGEDLITLGKWMRDYLDNTGLAETYEERMGIPFPREEKYWPGNFNNASSLNAKGVMETASSGSGTYQMLIRRVPHNFEPDLALSATQVFQHAIEQHYTYITCGGTTSQLRRLINDKDTAARLQSFMKPTTFYTFKKLIDTIDGAADTSSHATGLIAKALSKFLNSRARSLLSGALTTMIKQTTGIFHGLSVQGMGFGEYIAELLHMRAGKGHKSIKEVMELDSMKIRDLPPGITADMLTAVANKKLSPLTILGRVGMVPIEWLDRCSNGVAMAAVYNATYRKLERSLLREDGHPRTLTPEEVRAIEKICEETVSIALHNTAQPLQQHDKAAAVVLDANGYWRAFTWMGSEVLNKIGAAHAIYLREKAGETTKRSTIRALIKSSKLLGSVLAWEQGMMVIIGICNGTAPDIFDENGISEDFKKWLLWNAAYAATGMPLWGYIPIIGPAAQEGWNYAAKKISDVNGPINFTGDATSFTGQDYKTIEKLFDWEENSTSENLWNTANSLRLLGSVTGMFAPNSTVWQTANDIILGANTVFNASRLFIQRAKNSE